MYAEILKILGADSYFKRMGEWGWPIITGLHGNSSNGMQYQRDTYALLAGLRLLWIRFDRPNAGSNWNGGFKKFTLASRRMIDYWVYHQCGSMMMPPPGADGKLNKWLRRVASGSSDDDAPDTQGDWLPNITDKQWTDLLVKIIDDGLCRNADVDEPYKDYTHRNSIPSEKTWANWTRLLLVHQYSTLGLTKHGGDGDVTYEMDHIIPKSNWDAYVANGANEEEKASRNKAHNYVNFCLLDKTANISKLNHELTHPDVAANGHTIDVLKTHAFIPNEGTNYSDLSGALTDDHYEKLKELRKPFLIDKFIKLREKMFQVQTNWWSE